jgi:glycosyltransferase involved in cell wall biosynthesis
MSKLRVVHLVPNLFGTGQGQIIGGGERYAYELAAAMAKRTPTTLLSFGPEPFSRQDGSLHVQVIGPAYAVRGQATNPFHPRLIPLLARFDVIHCHQQHLIMSSIAAVLARLSHRLIFVSDLGGGGWDISSYISTDQLYHGHLHISQYSLQQAGHGNSKKAHVIYGGVDSDRFQPGLREKPNQRRVLFVGRQMPHKGIDDLVKACIPDIPLTILGRPYHEAYHQHLKQLAAGNDVEFRTNADDQTLVHSYQSALCIVLPSVYRTMYGHESKVPELLGQTLLEGMACGIPAICTNVASMPEVVIDQVTGFVVPANDPITLRERILQLKNSQPLCETYGKAARARVIEQFSWNTVVDRCMKIYQSS